MPNAHPFFIHFPIALLTVGLLFDIAGLLLRSDQLHRVGWWMQLSGSVGLAGTVVSGLLAERAVSVPLSAQSTFEMHKEVAFFVSAAAATLLLWRVSNRTLIPLRMKWLYVSLVAILVALVWVAAWYGGELVYSFGVGVMSSTK